MKHQRIKFTEASLPKPKRVKLYEAHLPTESLKLIDRAEVARYWRALAYTNLAQELPLRVAPCRYCWGVDFQFQFTLNEWRKEMQRHLGTQLNIKDPQKRVPFDELGGVGYSRKKKPNSECPECEGLGETYHEPLDIKAMSAGAQMLFDGLKTNRDGTIEIKWRNRDFAMKRLEEIEGIGIKQADEVPELDEITDEALDKAVNRAIQKGLVSIEDLRDENSVLEDVEYSTDD